MAAKSRYAGELLAELNDLTESDLRPEQDKAAILRHGGLLADLSAQELERYEQAVRRRTLFGGRHVRL